MWPRNETFRPAKTPTLSRHHPRNPLMSWIKEHSFGVGLGAATAVLAGGLLMFGLAGSRRYAENKARFDADAEEAKRMESLDLYPTAENRDGKSKALAEYRNSVEELQAAFDRFRPGEEKALSSDDFLDHLKKANEQIREDFGAANIALPDGFLCGFQEYATEKPVEISAGILDYQLAAIRSLMRMLSEARVSELTNLHRPGLPEERNQEFKPGKSDVARALPLELSFRANEDAVRRLITAIGKSPDHYFVIRSLRIRNERKTPPLTTDAKFVERRPIRETPATATAVDLIEEGGSPAPPTPAPAAPAPASDEPILIQVLGGEELEVFLRIDLMRFLPPKELPGSPGKTP
jgi:hypothetical protein